MLVHDGSGDAIGDFERDGDFGEIKLSPLNVRTSGRASKIFEEDLEADGDYERGHADGSVFLELGESMEYPIGPRDGTHLGHVPTAAGRPTTHTRLLTPLLLPAHPAPPSRYSGPVGPYAPFFLPWTAFAVLNPFLFGAAPLALERGSKRGDRYAPLKSPISAKIDGRIQLMKTTGARTTNGSLLRRRAPARMLHALFPQRPWSLVCRPLPADARTPSPRARRRSREVPRAGALPVPLLPWGMEVAGMYYATAAAAGMAMGFPFTPFPMMYGLFGPGGGAAGAEAARAVTTTPLNPFMPFGGRGMVPEVSKDVMEGWTKWCAPIRLPHSRGVLGPRGPTAASASRAVRRRPLTRPSLLSPSAGTGRRSGGSTSPPSGRSTGRCT